jgi:tetratricopeptide (TPR) repeat protein
MSEDGKTEVKDTSAAASEAKASQELLDLKTFLQTHGLPVAIGICLAVAIILALVYRQNNAEAEKTEALAKLYSAKSIQDITYIVDRQASTPAAPLALLKLAKIQFDAGNYDMAISKYNDFKTKYPKHEFVDAAELGRIHCIEARRQYEEAATAFGSFIAKDPKNYLAPEAMFGQARCLEQLGRYKEAKALYEDFITANQNSGWILKAKELLDAVTKKASEEANQKKITVTGTNSPAVNLQMPAFSNPAGSRSSTNS